jgi:hypothetical protein
MPSIQCTRWLWRRLGDARHDRLHVPDRIFHGVALGSWVAKLFRYDRRELVIALDERSYAVLVFSWKPARFRATFAAALGDLLEDLRVPTSVIAQECAALQFAPMRPVKRPAKPVELDMALATLDDAQYLCEVDLADISDLRCIQLHINEYPHATGPAPCAVDALAEVFAPALVRRWTKH